MKHGHLFVNFFYLFSLSTLFIYLKLATNFLLCYHFFQVLMFACYKLLVLPFFIVLIPCVTGFLTFSDSFVDICWEFNVIQSSSKSFENVIIKYYIDLSNLNLVPDAEKLLGGRVDKCKTQLEICTLWYVVIIAKITLGYKINKTTHVLLLYSLYISFGIPGIYPKERSYYL